MAARDEAHGSSSLFVPLETERLLLEPIRADHADALFAGLQEPSLYTYETETPPRDLRLLRAHYGALRSGRSPEDDEHWLNWILALREAGTAVGYAQATVDDDLEEGVIGYLLLPVYQRRGLATEGIGAMARHLLGSGVRALRAFIDVRNTASIALVERLGFVRERTHRSDDVIGGVRGFDHDYVLTAAKL